MDYFLALGLATFAFGEIKPNFDLIDFYFDLKPATFFFSSNFIDLKLASVP